MGPGIVGGDKGRLLVAFSVGDLTVDLVGEVPQQAHAILHQLGREPECLRDWEQHSRSASKGLAQPSS